MRFYDVPVNRSVPTEANRGLTSYRERPSASSLTRRTEENAHTTPIITNPSEPCNLPHASNLVVIIDIGAMELCHIV
jgi:hypothetical protein